MRIPPGEKNLSKAEIWTQGRWERSANATSVLCSRPDAESLFMCLMAWAKKNDTNGMRSKSFNARFPRSTKVCFLMELCRVDIRPFDRQRPLDAVSYFSEILRRVLWELLKLMEKKLKCSKKAKWMSSNMNLWDISFYLEGCYFITKCFLNMSNRVF